MCYTLTTIYGNGVLVNIICLILKKLDLIYGLKCLYPDTLRSCAKDVLKSNHQLDSLKQNGSCTLITYITRQSVRDCKPPPCNTDRNPDHNQEHSQKLLDCFLHANPFITL